MITLEEAIFHAEEVAEGKDKEAYNWEYYYDGNVPDTIAECKKCAAEHRQLAEWLKELKRLREQTRWIPVSERLPEEDTEVIVSCTDDSGDSEFSYTTTGWHFKGMWVVGNERSYFVIAWMPLPEPYKAESEDTNADSN